MGEEHQRERKVDDSCGNYQPLSASDQQEQQATSTIPCAFNAPLGERVNTCAAPPLDGLPDAALLWKQQSFLVKLWFSVSAVTLVSSLFWLELGLAAGLVGVAGALLTLCSCCRRDGTSLLSLLLVTRLLALLNAALSGGTAVALLYILSMRPCASLGDDDAFCHRLLVTLLVVAAWHMLHAVLAARVVLRVSDVWKALNPVSSGLVAIV